MNLLEPKAEAENKKPELFHFGRKTDRLSRILQNLEATPNNQDALDDLHAALLSRGPCDSTQHYLLDREAMFSTASTSNGGGEPFLRCAALLACCDSAESPSHAALSTTLRKVPAHAPDSACRSVEAASGRRARRTTPTIARHDGCISGPPTTRPSAARAPGQGVPKSAPARSPPAPLEPRPSSSSPPPASSPSQPRSPPPPPPPAARRAAPHGGREGVGTRTPSRPRLTSPLTSPWDAFPSRPVGAVVAHRIRPAAGRAQALVAF
jgi:hypothetical protein